MGARRAFGYNNERTGPKGRLRVPTGPEWAHVGRLRKTIFFLLEIVYNKTVTDDISMGDEGHEAVIDCDSKL